MKSIKFIGEIYKKGFGAFSSSNRVYPDGTPKSRYMMLVSILEMISMTISVIVAAGGIVDIIKGAQAEIECMRAYP